MHLVFSYIIYILLFSYDLSSARTALVTMWRKLFVLWTDHILTCTPCYVRTWSSEFSVHTVPR